MTCTHLFLSHSPLQYKPVIPTTSLASAGAKGWETKQKNVPVSCPLIEHGHFLPVYPGFLLHEGALSRVISSHVASLSFFQIVEVLFNALNQNLVQFELKPGVQVIVYVTQLTLGECLLGGNGCDDLLSWREKGAENYQTPLHKCLKMALWQGPFV